MKVREYIEELQKLDPERDIWYVHEVCVLPPDLPDQVADEYHARLWGVKEGDYLVVDCL